MRSRLWLTLLCACGGPQSDVTEPTADPVKSATSEPAVSPSATAGVSSTPADKTPPKDESGEKWSIETGSAKGVTLNDAGASLTLKTLGWTSRDARSPGPTWRTTRASSPSWSTSRVP